MTPLMAAVDKEHLQTAKFLLEQVSDDDQSDDEMNKIPVFTVFNGHLY